MIVFINAIPYQEELDIREMFTQLYNYHTYYSQLQFLYNNSQHFSTVSSDKNLCTHYKLREIAEIAAHRGGAYINVHGTIHNNYHSSNILKDTNGLPVNVKDTYIRISYWNSPHIFMHILMSPPIVTIYRPTEILFSPSFECDAIINPIMPIIISAFSHTDINTPNKLSVRTRAPLTIKYPSPKQSIPLKLTGGIELPKSRAISPPIFTNSKKYSSKRNKSRRKK